jgi:Transposase DDE domain group 1
MESQTILPFKLDGASDELLTRFAGLPLLAEAFRALGVKKDCERRVDWKERDRGLSVGEMVESFMLMLASGGDCLDDFNVMRADRGLAKLIGHDFPAPSTAWEFLRGFEQQQRPADPTEGVFIPADGDNLLELDLVNRNLVRRVAGQRPHLRVATLDLDAKIIESYKREAQPTYQGMTGYQPLIGMWAEVGMVLGDEFRDGNVRAAQGLKRFYQRLRRRLPEQVQRVRLRSDSAGYEHELIGQLVEEGVEFTISADMSEQLRATCGAVPSEEWKSLDEDDHAVRTWADVVYVPDVPKYRQHQTPDRYVAYRVVKRQGELFADGSQVKYFAVVTNMDWRGDRLLRWHWEKAGTIEHVHDVLANELGAGVAPSKHFNINATYFRLNVLCHNLLQALKLVALGEDYHYMRPKRLRFLLLSLAGRIVRHARQLTPQVSTAVTETIALYHHARRRLSLLATVTG